MDIRIPINMGDYILYVRWEEYKRYRDYYDNLQYNKIGRIEDKNVPQ